MATVKLYLNHAKEPGGALRKTEVSIVARVTLDRANRFEIPTGEKIAPRHWDFRTQSAKTSAVGQESINLFIQEFKRDIITLYRENRNKSFSEFKEILRGKGQKKTFVTAFDQFLKQYEAEGKDEKTLAQYKSVKNHVLASGGENIGFESLNSKFYWDFRAYFLKKEDVDVTFYKYAGRLQTFLRWAKEKGFPVNSEFEKWEIINHKPQPLAFTEEELLALESAILPRGLAIARDYFIVACRTGLRISDLKRLDAAQLVADTITLRTTKKVSIDGGKQITLYFTPGTFSAPALDILMRHGGKLPATAEPVLNRNLKTACDKAKITGTVSKETWKGGKCITTEYRKCDIVTLHMGKKTFITLALEKGTPIKNVAEMTGTSMKTIEQSYAAKSSTKINEGYLKNMVISKTA